MNPTQYYLTPSYLRKELSKSLLEKLRASQLEVTLACRDLRNTESTRESNSAILRDRADLLLEVLCTAFQCSSATTLVIPEGQANGANSLYSHFHSGIYLHGWEDRSPVFSSKDRLAKQLSEVFSVALDEDVSVYLRPMRSFDDTLNYACKGYTCSSHIPEISREPLRVTCPFSYKTFSKTPGEAFLAKSSFEFYRDTKIAQAASHLKAYLQEKDAEQLSACVQQLYDLELAYKRDQRRKPSKIKKGTPPKVKKQVECTFETAHKIQQQATAVEAFKPTLQALERQGTAPKEIQKRIRRVQRSATTKPTPRRKHALSPTVKSYLSYYSQFRKDRINYLTDLSQSYEHDIGFVHNE